MTKLLAVGVEAVMFCKRAIAAAFTESDRVVVIGTDCPSMTADLLDRAFQQLESQDVAIGAATDGSYYRTHWGSMHLLSA